MKRTLLASESSPYFKKLPREFYDQPSTTLGRELLGKVLARRLPSGEVLRGTIVETEAYPGKLDPASHSYGGKQTYRNGAMFMEPGTSYVYFTYGMYYCFNVSSSEPGGACLIRAVEPLENYETMHHLRAAPVKKKNLGNDDRLKRVRKPWKPHELANGPGKLCLAFNIVRDTCNALDLCTSDMLWMENSVAEKFQNGDFVIEVGKRVGIDSQPEVARNQQWRFFIQDNFAVSTAKPNQIMKRLKDKEKSPE